MKARVIRLMLISVLYTLFGEVSSAWAIDVATTAGGQLQAKVEALAEASNVTELNVSGPLNGYRH